MNILLPLFVCSAGTSSCITGGGHGDGMAEDLAGLSRAEGHTRRVGGATALVIGGGAFTVARCAARLGRDLARA